jgi:hypothetical protein
MYDCIIFACRLMKFMNMKFGRVCVLIMLLGLLFLSCSWNTEVGLNPPQNNVYSIGQNFGGGIIFYIDSTGQHGLISAPMDQSSNSKWSCISAKIKGTSTVIGTGEANTRAIVKACKEENTPARICDNLVLNGFSDWYLPSRDELNLMYLRRKLIGGFANSPYWSSSSFNPFYAWLVYFLNGFQVYTDVYYAYCVRAIRSF